jgi:hypothetical protein
MTFENLLGGPGPTDTRTEPQTHAIFGREFQIDKRQETQHKMMDRRYNNSSFKRAVFDTQRHGHLTG